MKKLFTLSICTFLIVFITGCTKQTSDVPSSEPLTAEQVLKEVTPIIQSFLNSQYEYAIGNDKIPTWDGVILSGGSILKNHIDEYKEALLYNANAKATAYTSKFVFDNSAEIFPGIQSSITGSGSVWTLKNVIDEFSITESIEGKSFDESDVMRTSNLYNSISLEKIDGKWRITSWEEHGIGGDSYFWYRAKERMSVSKTPSDGPQALASYNRSYAQIYAIAHVNNPSTQYPNYSAYGGDCTNFVSQCLEYGGWAQTSKTAGRASALSWFHDKGYTSPPALALRSTSWTAASNLAAYLLNTSRVNASSYPVSSMDIGDVIQLSSAAQGIHHSTVVTTRIVSGSNVVIKVHYRNAANFAVGENVDVTSFSSLQTRKSWKLKNTY